MLTQLEQFRNDLYIWFPHRADALMELLDALSSNLTARSVVELSLNPCFRRQYGSVHDGIENLFSPPHGLTCLPERPQWKEQEALLHLLVSFLPTPQRPFRLLGTDVTPAARPFARTLEDRTVVYQPNPVKGVKPITLGHQYSILAVLPEKTAPGEPPWVLPLLVERVASEDTKLAVGLAQIARLFDAKTSPFHQEFCVHVVDSEYSALTYQGGVASRPNLVTIARLPGNRTVYQSPPPPPEGTTRPRGHPTWFGGAMSLTAPDTWEPPNEVATTSFRTKKGHHYTVHLKGWHDRLRRGKHQLPMHQCPFTLVRAEVVDDEGHPVFTRPMWLTAIGERRRELSLVDIWEAYRQRYDLEHFFRFGKQRLLMDAYQTPDTSHEEQWWTFVQLASWQLWLSRDVAEKLPRPWERYLPRYQTTQEELSSETSNVAASVPSPSDVQRDMARIIRQCGTPAQSPKPRGKSPGRSTGQKPGKRTRHPVVKKSKQGS
jgi:hypothetical protein